MDKLANRWRWLLIFLVVLGAMPWVLCGGSVLWLNTAPPIALERIPSHPANVTWEGELTQEKALPLLQAVLAHEIGSAEVWLAQLPPDLGLALPSGAEPIGAVEYVRSPDRTTHVWLRLPPEEGALRDLARAFRKAGWREPFAARLFYRFLGPDAGKPPAGFVPPADGGFPRPLYTRLFCRPGTQALMELHLYREADTGRVVAALRVQRERERTAIFEPPIPCSPVDALRFAAWVVQGPLFGFFGPQSWPGVVRLPRLTPLPGVYQRYGGFVPWVPGQYVGHTWLWVDPDQTLLAQTVMEHYARQMHEQGWKEGKRTQDGKGIHTQWEKRSPLGRVWVVDLSVLQHGPHQVSGWMHMYLQGQSLETWMPLVTWEQEGRVQVYGTPSPAAVKALLEQRWTAVWGPTRVKVWLNKGKEEVPVPIPETWQILAEVGKSWGPSPGAPVYVPETEERIWIFHAPESEEAARTRLQATLKEAGWHLSAVLKPGWESGGFRLPTGFEERMRWGEWCRKDEEGRTTFVHLLARPAPQGGVWVYVTELADMHRPCPPPEFQEPRPEGGVLPHLPVLRLPEGIRADFGPPVAPVDAPVVWVDGASLDRVWEHLAGQMQEQGWHLEREAESGPFRWAAWVQTEDETRRVYLFAWRLTPGRVLLLLEWDPKTAPESSFPGD